MSHASKLRAMEIARSNLLAEINRIDEANLTRGQETVALLKLRSKLINLNDKIKRQEYLVKVSEELGK